jgi:hypothetical protein
MNEKEINRKKQKEGTDKEKANNKNKHETTK